MVKSIQDQSVILKSVSSLWTVCCAYKHTDTCIWMEKFCMSLLRFMKMKVFSPTLYISFENKEANEIRRLDRFTEKRRNSIGKRDRSRPDFKILQAYLSGYFPVKLSDFLSICFSLTLQGWLVSPCHLERSAGLKCNILGIRLEIRSDISWIYGAVCWFFLGTTVKTLVPAFLHMYCLILLLIDVNIFIVVLVLVLVICIHYSLCS